MDIFVIMFINYGKFASSLRHEAQKDNKYTSLKTTILLKINLPVLVEFTFFKFLFVARKRNSNKPFKLN